MKYFLCVLLFTAIYFVSQIIAMPENEMFYAVNSAWSLIIIIVFSSVLNNRISLLICISELAHITLNLVTCALYVSGNYENNFVYIMYPSIQNIINLAEALVLFAGVPFNGILNRLSGLFSGFLHNNTSNIRRF